MIRVKRAASYGFCAGVRSADLKIRRHAAAGDRSAVLGPPVHNERVVAELEVLGLRVIDRIEDASEPTIVFSAHGVPPSFHERARALGLHVLDTTCTFVRNIHEESRRALDDGCHLAFLGDPNHREVVGYTHDLDPGSFHVVSSLADAEAVDWSAYPSIRIFFQTTLNADDFEAVVGHLERSNPNCALADTICYATRDNQRAAGELAADPEVELVLVVGGTASANTRHLWEIACRHKPAHLIQGACDIRSEWLDGVSCVGLTAGASTPDSVVDEVEEHLRKLIVES
jgi:4-hydroxy-3-methylbut-2-enyl diphosphate reductase